MLHKIYFVDIEIVFLKVFLWKIISTISNSSYTSQIHCRNALRLDPVIQREEKHYIYHAKIIHVHESKYWHDVLLSPILGKSVTGLPVLVTQGGTREPAITLGN